MIAELVQVNDMTVFPLSLSQLSDMSFRIERIEHTPCSRNLDIHPRRTTVYYTIVVRQLSTLDAELV